MDHRAISFVLAGGVITLDRVSKIWIAHNLGPYDKIPVIPGIFDIVHSENRGMAFGLLNNGKSDLRTLVLAAAAVVVLCIVLYLIWRLPRQPTPGEPFTPVILGLVLGGAIGNLWDRMLRGSVTDFLDFYLGSYHWPAFNVADSAITIGVCLLALEWLWPERKTKASRNASETH